MSRRLLIAVFAASLLATAVARFPLSLALTFMGAEQASLTALSASGTVWNGRLERAALGPRLIGDVELGLEPTALLGGRMRLAWQVRRPGLEGSGDLIARTDGVVALEEVRLSGRLLDLPTLVPLEGTARLEAERIVVGPEGCRSAEARLWTDTLQRSRANLRWRGPVLEGSATCRGEALVLSLDGRESGSRVAVEARLQPDLAYTVDVAVTTRDRDLARRLSMLGFEAGAENGYRLVQKGRLQPAKETS